jgi:sortase A
MIAYPYVSDWYHKSQKAAEILVQENAVDEQTQDEIQSEFERAYEYNEKLTQNYTVVTDPFDPNAGTVPGEDYDEILNINGDGVMATLYIPTINVAMPVYHTTDEEVLQKGVGHMPTTSLPVGGPSTHAVLAGHNGLPSMKVFDDLTQLEVGDYFIIRVLGEDHAYRITSIETVLPSETESCTIQEGKDLVTLVTCVPYGINTHRLLVHAERCEVPQEWLDQGSEGVVAASQASTRLPLIILTLIGAGVAAVLIAMFMKAKRKRDRNAAIEAATAERYTPGTASAYSAVRERGKHVKERGRHKDRRSRGRHARSRGKR